MLALLLNETIDMPNVTADGKDALPSRDKVGPDYWMDCLKPASNILESSLLASRTARSPLSQPFP